MGKASLAGSILYVLSYQESNAVHDSTERRQLEALCLVLSWTLPYVLLLLANFNPYSCLITITVSIIAFNTFYKSL